MKQVNQIVQMKEYRECYDAIWQLEMERPYCKHNMGHFLDVARIACMMKEERGLSIPREAIYMVGILHDIGRHLQYTEGIPHEKASAKIARYLLETIAYDPSSTEEIVKAIENHRNKKVANTNTFAGIIYDADKASRACYACKVQEKCDWSQEKKNLEIKY